MQTPIVAGTIDSLATYLERRRENRPAIPLVAIH